MAIADGATWIYVVQIALLLLVYGLFEGNKFLAALDAVPGLLSFSDPSDWFGYGFGVLWTLAIEFWFYVSFPLLLWAAALTGRLVPWIVGGIAISLIAKALHFGGATYYDQFLLGSLCAIAIKSQRTPWFAFLLGCFVASILAIFLIAEIPFPGSRNLVWFCESLAAAAVTALAILERANQTERRSTPSKNTRRGSHRLRQRIDNGFSHRIFAAISC